MDDRNNSQSNTNYAQSRPERAEIETLQTAPNCVTIERKVEIFSQIAREIKSIIYLVAELYLGEKPKKL